MTKSHVAVRPASYALQWFSALTVLYTALIFTLPANHVSMQAYHLTPTGYRIILFALVLPSYVVWLAAFMGYAALQKYAFALRNTDEGRHFQTLATGATWLAWSLPVVSITSIILNTIANKWPGFHAPAIILTNYTSLILILIAFGIIGRAAHNLLNTTSAKITPKNARSITVLFILCGILYCYSTFQHFQQTSLTSNHNPYYLPVWLVTISFVLPSIFAWFMGILASYKIAIFSKNISGVLYRKPLRYVAIGLITVVASQVALQYINVIVPRTGHLVLDYHLVITISIRIVGAIGFVLMAIGSNRLKKIEEV